MTFTRVDLSVIVPVFNAQHSLPACLDSLVSQSYPPERREIIVVDNGSSDSSAAIAGRYPGVRLVHEKRPGAYAARNHGVGQARGDILAFIDPDCVAEKDWLASLAAALSSPGTGIVLGPRRAASPSSAARMIADYENLKAEYVLTAAVKELCYGYTNNMAVRRELFDALGPFVERPRGSDTNFVRQAVEVRGCGVARYCPEAVVTHGELDGIRGYYRKVFLYGRHRARNRPMAFTRPLNSRERLTVAGRTVRAGEYPLSRSLLLGLVLAGGLIAWQLGTAAGRRDAAGAGVGPAPGD